MSRLPQVSGKDVVRVLGKIGYEQDRIRGSHIILRQAEQPHRRITVPDHNPVAKVTLRAILREVGLTVEEFIDLLRG